MFGGTLAMLGMDATIGGSTLPNTGVKISMIAFGGLSLLFLGAAAFFASRRWRKPR